MISTKHSPDSLDGIGTFHRIGDFKLFLIPYIWTFILVFHPEEHFIKAGLGHAYLNGFFLGMLTALAILYFLFSSEKEKDPEELTFASLVSYWVVLIACPVLVGFIGMIIHGIGQNWVGILLSILLMVAPVLVIIRSIAKDGLPLGNREEWREEISSYSSSSGSYSSGSSSASPSGEASKRYEDYESKNILQRHCESGWVWARDIYVSEVGENDFSIDLTFYLKGYRSLESLGENIASMLPNQEEEVINEMAGALSRLGVGYRFSASRSYS